MHRRVPFNRRSRAVLAVFRQMRRRLRLFDRPVPSASAPYFSSWQQLVSFNRRPEIKG